MKTLIFVITITFATSSFAANQSYQCFDHSMDQNEDDDYIDHNNYLLKRLSGNRYSLKIYRQRDSAETLHLLRTGYWESEDGQYALSVDSRGKASLETQGGYFRVDCE